MLAGYTVSWSYYQLNRWLTVLGSISFKNVQMWVWKASYLQCTFNSRLVIISLVIIMLVTGLINNNTHLVNISHENRFFKTFYILSFLWQLLKSLTTHRPSPPVLAPCFHFKFRIPFYFKRWKLVSGHNRTWFGTSDPHATAAPVPVQLAAMLLNRTFSLVSSISTHTAKIRPWTIYGKLLIIKWNGILRFATL